MRKIFFLSFSCLTLIHAQDAIIDADLGIGHRNDRIDYTIFTLDDTSFPDLTFKFNDFNMPTLQGNFKGTFKCFLIFAKGSYSRFWDGEGRFSLISPSPYSVNSSVSQIKTAGHATIASGGGGFPLPIYRNSSITLLVIPVAGYRYDHIRFKQMDPRPPTFFDPTDTGALTVSVADCFP